MSSTRINLADLVSLPTYTGTSTSRLQALYADISRQKQSNPPSYQSTIHWWRQTIQSVVLKGWLPRSTDYLVLHAAPILTESFRYEGVGKPLCLATVIAELSEAKAYVPLNQFLTSSKSVYDPGWLPLRIASYVVGKPFWWALQQLNVVASDEGGHQSDTERWKKVKGDYVLLDLVESASRGIIARQEEKDNLDLSDRLYTVTSFREEFAGIIFPDVVLSELDTKILVRYLERDQRLVIVDKEVIKFIDRQTDESANITAVDRGIVELKTAVANVQRQTEKIQHRILERTQNASLALKNNRKEVALSHLRARKQLEDLLNKRLGALENLQSTLLSVERAAGDVEIMKSYESSTATLKSILSHPSLQREKIEETMDAMASASQDAQEIDETIRLGGELGDQNLDEQELEDELKALVTEAEEEKRKAAETLQIEKLHKLREAPAASDPSRNQAGLHPNDHGMRVDTARRQEASLSAL